jgi:excisionase family DNA binding protein
VSGKPAAADHKVEPEWLTVEQACDLLSVGKSMMYQWVRENRIQYARLGDSANSPIRIHRGALLEYMQQKAGS